MAPSFLAHKVKRVIKKSALTFRGKKVLIAQKQQKLFCNRGLQKKKEDILCKGHSYVSLCPTYMYLSHFSLTEMIKFFNKKTVHVEINGMILHISTTLPCPKHSHNFAYWNTLGEEQVDIFTSILCSGNEESKCVNF